MGKLDEWANRLDEKADRLEEKRKERNEKARERNAKLREDNARLLAEAKEETQLRKERHKLQDKPTEQEKFYKRANTAGKGIALYFAMPLFLGIAIVLTFIGFQIWEWIF
ncbi:hypothetical protein [Halobacillus karajensis]|uniref:Uncharacterized protein n=1 Tax=Halobacillus karajensis TaxID=195088 RepID=A0A059NUY0_9BACI|nr:hypothetical protein [Halobacillus karajensis]CDQ22584.1 hypothetical protein BN983_00797 [Halobacillus karajensis]CDQ26066.1 hypothetical protein BN981_00277 [Halobacillus karajensis]